MNTELNKYINKWVAFEDSTDKIVGAGNDAVEAKKDAEKKGYKGELVFFKVFPFSQYVPASR
ncbi:MAG TPA: DUF5678 domain-containing protein [Patescibacteria group bacterium]